MSPTFRIADKPNNSTWPAFYAVSILTGIGFTMSLFVGNLAFANDLQYMDGVKIGVLTGSLLSTLFGVAGGRRRAHTHGSVADHTLRTVLESLGRFASDRARLALGPAARDSCL